MMAYVFALVSAVFTWRAFPPYTLGIGLLIALVPVFYAAEKANSAKSAFKVFWVWGFISNLLVCIWIPSTIIRFSHLPTTLGWVLGVLCLGLVSAFEQLPWAIVAWLRFYFRDSRAARRWPVVSILFTPVTLFALESFWPKYFPNTLGNSFHNNLWIAQGADLFGVVGLTVLIGFTNENLARALVAWQRRQPRIQIVVPICAALVVFGLFAGYGRWRLRDIQNWIAQRNDSPRIRIALIQNNLNTTEEIRVAQDDSSRRNQLLSEQLAMTYEILPAGPEMVFWPETAYPDTYRSDSPTERKWLAADLDRFLLDARGRAPRPFHLIFGARDQIGDFRYNAMLWLDSQLTKHVYQKSQLLLFAEKVPFSTWFPRLAVEVRRRGGTAFMPGPGPRVFNVPLKTGATVALGPMICVEGLFWNYVRKMTAAGAEILVNATNDAWYDGAEPDLHFELTKFRSIENRRVLIRSTNTGYSGVIDIDGSVRVKTNRNEKTVAADDIPFEREKLFMSVYTLIGGWVEWVSLALTMIFALLIWLQYKRVV